ncbi:DNA-binding protein [Finegoldia magna]|uniref:DNA-binding protein n=1 Tax=Finegoldia magna TaxID=1260 RepID=UPI001D15A83C|nr:DNA-binding protein [Finegoldia magna]UEB34031.1 DNA-binding protein [Finegoldia magna]
MLLNVTQVRELLSVPQSTAYKIIRDLNAELKEQGYIVLRGRVEEKYLKERFRLDDRKDIEC